MEIKYYKDSRQDINQKNVFLKAINIGMLKISYRLIEKANMKHNLT